MNFAYDARSRGLFINLIDSNDYAESQEVAEGVVLDFDRKGRVVRIELEDAAAVVDVASVLQLVKPRIRGGGDLRQVRERLGLSQQEFGDALDIPRNTIARWERGELQMERTRLLELAVVALIHGAAAASRKSEITGILREEGHYREKVLRDRSSKATIVVRRESGERISAKPAPRAAKAGFSRSSAKKR